ncbi:MAG: EamA family transporter [Brevibacillus sp.]|nr:EamA family transporter [Brevibacillus sp.]
MNATMLLAYVTMCLIFGTSYFAIKLGLEEGIAPFLYAGLRFLFASLLVLLIMFVRRRLGLLHWKVYLELGFLGILMTTIPFAALFWAEQYISSGTAALLVATAPIFTTLFSLYRKQMTFRWFVPAGLLISMLGTILLIGWSHDGGTNQTEALLGKLAIILSELFFSYGAVRSREWVTRLTPFVFNGYQMLFASFGLLLLSFLTEPYAETTFTVTLASALFYLVILVSIAASTLYYWLVQETNAAFPTTWTYVAPVIATAIGYLFLGEALTASHMIGSLAVLLGVILLNGEGWAKLRQLRTNATQSPGLQDER